MLPGLDKEEIADLLVHRIDEGRLVKAVRRHEGVETDQYGCERGHRFAMDFPRGPATEPEWPPPPDVVAMPSEKP